jgi:hypothetical protein
MISLQLLFLILQVTSLTLQVVCIVVGIRKDDMFHPKACYGYAIWGGFFTVLLGAVGKSVS